MRNICKIFLLSLCIFSLSSTAIYANTHSDFLKAEEKHRIQPQSISDLTYVLFVWTGSNLFPSYFPQFEFEAGNSLRATNVSSNFIELTGIWTEVEFGDLFSYFTAQVEQEDTTTTTISIPPTERENQAAKMVQPLGTKMVDLWGISFNFSFGIPPPFDDISFGVSMLIGGGTYLGKNAVFAGFAGVELGEEPSFGSISPGEGTQGDKLTVTITGQNTNFETGETVVIWGEGITNVGVPDVDSETELSQQIEIAENAPLGLTSVTVTFPAAGGGTGSITGVDEFEVLEQAN